jgi:predicted GTPase
MAAHSKGEQGMVLVMGVTGAGKSYFINRLKDGSVVEGSTMDSCEFPRKLLSSSRSNIKCF